MPARPRNRLFARHAAQLSRVGALLLLGVAPGLRGMQVTGYTAAQNNRFASGFPASPVWNIDPAFVGLGRDWSGAAWDNTNAVRGFPFISPSHYLVARHYGGATTLRAFDATGTLRTGTQTTVEETGYGILFAGQTVGDLSLGTLQSALPNLARYGVLDLNATSAANSPANYAGQALFAYGRGPNGTSSPRIGATTAVDVLDSPTSQYLRTNRLDIQLEEADSGSPLFADWTNPDGNPEPAILGNHAAISGTTISGTTYNFHNFLGLREVMGALNTLMTDDGRSLRVVGNPSNSWVGSSSVLLSRNAAWGIGGKPTSSGATSDKFVLFDGATAASRNVTVDTNYNLRGLYFKSTGTAGDAFAFSGSPTLTVGRGGITNYDADPQLLSTNLALGDHQFWDAGPGGLALTNLNTNGKLLELRSAGTTSITGTISGSGGLALDSGTLLLGGSSTYTGPTWAHSGTLRVNGSILSSSTLQLASPATLSGFGSTAPIAGGGTVSPGPGAAVLRTPAVGPAGGLDFAFVFTGASPPQFASPANSINDLLRLTGTTPFATPLTAANRVALYLDVPVLQSGQFYRGGFFTDQPADFYAALSGATIEVFVADDAGPVLHEGQLYSAYAGPLVLVITAQPQSADFGGGTVAGRILQIEVQPDPASYAGWAQDAFPEGTPEQDRSPDADPNLDGLPNLLAYGLNIDPINTPRDKLPTHTYEQGPGGPELVFHFRRNRIADDLTYAVRISDDLAAWSTWAGSLSVVDPDADGNGETELVEARIPLDPGDPRLFVTLDILLP